MRKGFFFSLDAFLASALLIIILFVITQHINPGAPQQESVRVSQDAMQALSAIQVGEIQDPWVQARIADGSIDDPTASVILQLGKFWALNETSNAQTLSSILLTDVLPTGFDVTVYLEDDVLYNDSASTYLQQSAARRMISGVAKGQALQGSTGAAYLQKVSGKQTSSFAFFGGFVGQGNVSAIIQDIPSDVSTSDVKEIFLEGEFDDDFTVFLNDVQCGGTYTTSIGDLVIDSYNLTSCATLIQTGDNTVELRFETLENGSISGGFLRVSYVTGEFTQFVSPNESIDYLSGIEGVINLYSGLTVPGTLENMSLYLHYEVIDESAQPIFFDIGNVTIYEANVSGEITVTLSDSYLRDLLDYSLFTETTVPYRFGYTAGNSSNSSGNITDVFLVTSRHNSMGDEDIIVDATTNISRIDQVKIVDKIFVDIVLNSTGNRVGLASFGTGNSIGEDSDVSTDNTTLHSIIDGYEPHPGGPAQRNLCGALEWAKDELLNEPSGRNPAIMFMTDGEIKKSSGQTDLCFGGKSTDLEEIWADTVKQACDFVDPDHGNPQNITFYAVAFGPEAANSQTIRGNLSQMANCTGGQFAYGTNVSELTSIYEEFAANISASSIVYEYQRITAAEGIASNLYPDSFFNLTYSSSIPTAGPTQLEITFQTDQFGSCNPTIEFPEEMDVIGGVLNSYSGDYWTKSVSVNGTSTYNLSSFGQDYAFFGDPARVYIPGSFLVDTYHEFDISIGANATHDATCSFNNSLIYSALVNTSVSRGAVLPHANGCIWTIEFEDGENITTTIPPEYTGSSTCNYTNASISYNATDTYDEVVFRLLDNLDFDDDGRIFVNLDAADLEVVVSVVSDVPYLWGPSIARVVVSR